MNDNTKSAGIAILNYAYHTCDQFAVPKDELPELFTQLRDAIAIGQVPKKHPQPIMEPLQDVPPEIQRSAEEQAVLMGQCLAMRNATGLTFDAIGEQLGIARETARRYYILAKVLTRSTASLPEPQSDPASG